MKHATPYSRLPTAAKEALNRIERTVFGFDRLTLWVNHAEPDLKLDAWKKYCRDVKISPLSVKFQPMWQTKIELYQPRMKALRLLSKVIGNRWDTKFNYAEIAIDWLTLDANAAHWLRAFLLEHLYVPSMRDELCLYKDTVYFKSLASEAGKKQAHNVVLYSDKPSKLYRSKPQEAHCCHLEHRFTGFTALTKIGLPTIHDCAAFSHPEFWVERLQLRTYSVTDVGRLTELSDADVSDAMLRKRGRAFLDGHVHDGIPVLQDLLVELRETAPPHAVKQLLKPIDNQHFLKVARSA